MIEKRERIKLAIAAAEGNIKHEGMFLLDEERKLIEQAICGEISQKQFNRKVIELHNKNYNQGVKEIIDILNDNNLNVIVRYDDETFQWEVFSKIINANGCGDTKDQAIYMFLDSMIELTKDYFENIDLYLSIENANLQLSCFLNIVEIIESKGSEKILWGKAYQNYLDLKR